MGLLVVGTCLWSSATRVAQTVTVSGALVLGDDAGPVSGALVLGDDAGPVTSETDYSDAVVWLSTTEPSASAPARSAQRFEILQRDKTFAPRVLPVPLGSTVDFPNLDPFFHNVFSLFEGKRFDLGLYEAGTNRSTRFDRPGISYIFCNIHPEMVAVVITIDTELFVRADVDGRFVFNDVPPGQYQLHVWHERMEATSDEIAPRYVSVEAEPLDLSPIPLNGRSTVLENHANKFGQEYEAPVASGVPYLGR